MTDIEDQYHVGEPLPGSRAHELARFPGLRRRQDIKHRLVRDLRNPLGLIMLGSDLCHDVVNHVDETVRLVWLEQVVPSVPLAKFSLEAVDCHDVMNLQGPDVLNRVEDARADGELHLDQADLLDCLGKILSHVVLRVV